MQSIFLRGGKQTERAVERQAEGIGSEFFCLAQQSMKLRLPKQLTVSTRGLAPNRNVHRGRAQQHGLGEGHVVPLQQMFRACVLEVSKPLLAFQIGNGSPVAGRLVLLSMVSSMRDRLGFTASAFSKYSSARAG